jgi:hypothetical protein
VEPPDITIACADDGEVLQTLHWSSWTSTSAVAVGTLAYKDCTPNCAQGRIVDVPDTEVTLSVPVRDPSGHLVWSQVLTNPQPPGFLPGPQLLPTNPD